MTVKVRSYMGETVDFELLKLKQELSAAATPGEAAISIVPEEIDAAILFKRPDLQNKLLGRLARHQRNTPQEQPNESEDASNSNVVDATIVVTEPQKVDSTITSSDNRHTHSIHKRGK